MSSWFSRAFGYGLGNAVGRAIFGDSGEKPSSTASREPVLAQTEEQIRADEKRYDEEAKRYEAEDQKAHLAK